MRSNASITAWSKRIGARGDGEPLFEVLDLTHPLPAESVMPGASLRAQAQSVGIELTRLVHVPARALMVQGIEPGEGDRITVRTARPIVTSEVLDVVGIRPLGVNGDEIALEMGVRRDAQ